MPASDQLKRHAQARFAQFAQHYVTSASHAKGADLDRLLELAQPQPTQRMLDVATGGGHTALKFAPRVARVIAFDLTPKMLVSARAFVSGLEISNITFAAGDGENLPFARESFDRVTCRIAPHHFPDSFRFIQECKRVLAPGGLLLVEDYLAPDDERAARYVNAFERLRDPSHHRTYADYEWRGMFLDADLTVELAETLVKTDTKLVPWAERQGCPPDIVERLQVMLAQAPAAVAEWMRPQCVGTADASFDHHYLIIVGSKGTRGG
jgi:ubiquinone/menaquinone biosynthesis C-methylase UbiE